MTTNQGLQSTRWTATPEAWMAAALAVFWISAAAGVWSSYSKSDALIKLGVISASILLYFGIVLLLPVSPRVAAASAAGTGALLALVFLLSHDWRVGPADFAVLNRLGMVWMAVRHVRLPVVTAPNLTGGKIAALLPFWLAWAWMEVRSLGEAGPRRFLRWMGVGLVGLILAAGLALTSSRAAWISLAAAAGLALGWSFLIPRMPAGGRRITIWVLAVSAAAALLIGFFRFAAILRWMDSLLPGLPSGASRLQIITDTLHLAADFPLIGGGLEAFPGLYSHYMRVLPHYTFGYSHNLYLDAALSQGLPGLLALVFSYGLALVLLLRLTAERSRSQDGLALSIAALTGMLVVLIHGLIDDAFYGGFSSFLLFLFPAVAIYGWKREYGVVAETVERRRVKILQPVFWILFLIPAGLLARQIAAVALVNLAAIEMAKVQLAGFPSGAWEDGSTVSRLEPAEDLLLSTLALNPTHPGANYRLGLIAMLRRDYPGAILRLEAAEAAAPEHYGVMKNLGYAYLWSGQEAQARLLLEQVPEAAGELEAYVGWWQMQGRGDLSRKAAAMMQALRSSSN